jgi:hypothetical protein
MMKLIKEYLAEIGVVTGAIAILTAKWLKVDERTLSAIYILIIIFTVLLFTFVISQFNKIRGQNVLLNFVRGNLSPNRSRKYLEFEAKLVIVEDVKAERLHEVYKKQFEEVSKLEVKGFLCDSSGDIEQQTDALKDTLEGAKAVIIVRTKELEQNFLVKKREDFFWVYETIHSWAKQNSHAPCLVIHKITKDEEKELIKLRKLSPIPETFFLIIDNKPSLPWKLMQRANERAEAWKYLASFARTVVFCLFVLFIASFIIGCVWLHTQRGEYKGLFRGAYDVIAAQTRDEFNNLNMTNGKDGKDDKLNVSYWFYNHECFYGKIEQLGTTHKETEENTYEATEKSIIGCGYVHPDSWVMWDHNKAKPEIRLFNGNLPPSHDCGYGELKETKIKSIVCATHSGSDPKTYEYTVGICIFTENERNDIFSEAALDYLKKKTTELHYSIKE